MLKSLSSKFGFIVSLMMLASSSAFAYGGWVAIVFDPATGRYGSFHGAQTRYDAEAQALALCGAACASVDVATLESGQSNIKETWMKDGWVAFAKGNGTHWGTSGIHTSQYEAEQAALSRCGGEANGCLVARSVSSYTFSEDVDGTR